MMMKVLVVGNGGREHALAFGLARSASVREVLVAPGNGGTSACARNVDIAADDGPGIVRLCQNERVGLVVIGPEAPLCRGLADVLRAEGFPVFGPGAAGAELEGSKAFAKSLMNQHGVPTAGYRVFDSAAAARDYLEGEVAYPVVVKASGLAAGKGVIICKDLAEAVEAVERIMELRAFGVAGSTVVIEDHLNGEEVSIHAVTDGRTLLTLPTSQDHKRAFDGDTGPNTGGMGAVSPSPLLDGKGLVRIEEEIMLPTLNALARADRKFRGCLYAGLMVTRAGAKVLEYNVRFGDPETQVLIPRLRGDLGLLFLAVAEGRLAEVGDDAFDWDPRPAVTVVACSGGYPGAFTTGHPISGLEAASRLPDVSVFHSGTTRASGAVTTAGGRVISVTALGVDLAAARERAYEAMACISFPNMHVRHDIGLRALRRKA